MRIFVLTSNAYVHCIPPFSYLFNKFWGENQQVVVAGFEQRPSELPRNFTFWQLGEQNKLTWSQGAERLLERIDEDFFILMLEDYFIDRPAKTGAIYAMENVMEQNPGIAKIDLTDDRLKLDHKGFSFPDQDGKRSIRYGMIESAPHTLFQTSLQAAIWRKDFFLRFLRADENPWQFEKAGTKRVIQARKAKEFTGLILGFAHPPLSYINAIGGEGNHPQEWALKRFPQWMLTDLRAKGFI